MARLSRVRNVVLGVLVLVIALVALGPTILGAGPGKAIVAGAVADRVNGTVEVDSASFGWFAGQSIEGLLIRDAAGREAVNVDVSVDRGLVSLLLGPKQAVPIAVSGRVAGELREDGSTSFQDLLADTGGGAGGGGRPEPKQDEPFSLAGVPPFGIEIDGLAVTLDLAGAGEARTLTLDGVNGHAHYAPGGKLDVQLSSPTTSGSLRGSIEVRASAGGLFDAQGALRPAGALVNVSVAAQSLPVPFAAEVEELRQLALGATTNDLSEKLDVTIHVDTLLGDAEPSVLDGALTFAAPLTASGAMRVGLDTIRGEVTGRRVPTALLQPALAGSPIVLSRDVGPSIDVTAGFEPSATDEAQTDVAVSLTAAAASMEMEATVGADGAIAGGLLTARAVVPPALSGAMIEQPLPVTLELTSFALPARQEDGLLLDAIAFDGSVTIPEVVQIALAEDADPIAVDGVHIAFASSALGEGVTVTGHANVAGSPAELEAGVVLVDDAVHVTSAKATMTVTPALAAVLQGASDDPIELLAPCSALLVVEPFTLPELVEPFTLPGPINAHLSVDRADVRSSAITEPLRIDELGLDLYAGPDLVEPYAVRGQAVLRRVNGKERLGNLTCDVTAQRRGETLWPRGTVAVEEIQVGELAALLGHEREAATGWLGSTGAITVALGGDGEARDVTVCADLPNLSGELRAALEDDLLEITAKELRLTLARGVLENALRPEPDPNTGETPPGVTVPGDVPLTVVVERVALPMGLVRSEPFEPAAFDLNARLRGGPLTLVHPGDVVSTFDELGVTLETSDLSEGIRFALRGKARAGDGGEAGGFSIDGTVTGLLTEQSTFDAGGAAITTEGTVERLPTSIGDAFLGLEGLLVAAVGDDMAAAFRSSAFSKSSGWIDGRIDVPQGYVEARLSGQEGSLRTSKTRPLKGELTLTPALRERLLAPIHPILKDVRTTEQPIRFAVGNGARVPVDGDLSRLKADFEITIGPVEFDSGSTMLGLLSLFSTPKKVIPGSIDPIVGKIRDGVVQYDRFTVHIDAYELAYTGRVDLVNKTIDLRTEIPLKALATSFKELEGYADRIVVPLVTRGTFDKNKTEIDPSFDLGAAAIESGFGGAIDELLKSGEGEGLGKLFGDLLGGKKKKGDK